MNLKDISVVIVSHRKIDFKNLSFFGEVILYITDDDIKYESFDNIKVFYGSFEGFSKTKQTAINKATKKWIFLLDSDEVISDELIKELQNLSIKFQAYKIPRKNYFFGKFIRYGGFYPDYVARLFENNIKMTTDAVHEKIEFNGKFGYLKSSIIHFAYDSIDEFITKQNYYSSLNKKCNFLKAIISPYFVFFKIYIFRLGFLEGRRGFVIAKLYAIYTFLKYIKCK